MNNKVKKFLAVLLVVIAIASIGLIGASATSSKPYSSKNASIAILKTSATAYIKKCDCSPVNNYLAVWIRVQYEEDGQYYWDPSGTGTYYYDEGTNVDEARKKVSGSKICYTDGYYYARCGSGQLREYEFEVNKK